MKHGGIPPLTVILGRWFDSSPYLNETLTLTIMNEILKALQEIKQLTLLQAKKVLEMDDAVLLTGLSKARLYALTSAHKIPFYKSPEGRCIYFDRAELEAWMLSRRFDSQADLERKAEEYCKRKPLKNT